MLPIYEQSTLVGLKDKLLIIPSGVQKPGTKVLSIDRRSGSVDLHQAPEEGSLKTVQRKVVFGVLGIVKSPGQDLLLVVSRKVRVGEIQGHVVWRIDTVEAIEIQERIEGDDLTNDTTALIKKQLVSVFSTPYFYFSCTVDLTLSQQRLLSSSDDVAGNKDAASNLDLADKRFVWNLTFLENMMEGGKGNEYNQFALPIIHGAVFINKCSINGHGFTWCLVSRRSRFKTGARLFSRGCDESGNAANFVETEQLVISDTGMLSSFVQVRGSMPMRWQQYPDLRYKPPPKMISSADSLTSFLAHFRELLPIYGDMVLVNLVDQKKAEGELEINFRNLVNEANLSGVHYVAFDFHRECKKMRYDRLSILIDKLSQHIHDFEYYFVKPNDPSSIKRQKGAIRTNCVDSLDRTNVVQSLLATENLKVVLKRMGILSADDDILKKIDFQHVFRNTWADHADMISVQYAGTGALKTDYTRTGKRTHYGLLQDGWNASNRYILNNFVDGDRTDALRFVSGEVTAEQLIRAKHAASARRAERGALGHLPNLLRLIMAVLLFTLFRTNEVSFQFVFIVASCIVFLAVTGKIILQNGKELVNNPCTLKRIT